MHPEYGTVTNKPTDDFVTSKQYGVKQGLGTYQTSNHSNLFQPVMLPELFQCFQRFIVSILLSRDGIYLHRKYMLTPNSLCNKGRGERLQQLKSHGGLEKAKK